MSFFGKKVGEYLAFSRTGMILIVLMGLIRCFVGISAVPYERATHLVSMTVLTLLLFVIYGHRVAAKGFGTYRHLLPTAASLPLTMYGFIMLAILTEGVTGLHGYFHFHSLQNMAATMPSASNIVTPTASNLLSHMGGQILVAIPFTFLGWGLASMGFLLSRYLTFLRNAFLMLAALGIFRVLIGAVGVPESIGTWISSLSLLMMILAVYYGYSAPSHGFNRYWHFILIGLLISVVQSLIVIASILITTNFGLANYFTSEIVSVTRHIVGHLGSAIGGNLTIPVVILAAIGFATAGRKPALKSQPRNSQRPYF